MKSSEKAGPLQLELESTSGQAKGKTCPDCVGEIRAELQAAYVARGGNTINPAGDTPDIIGQDLGGVADQILRQG